MKIIKLILLLVLVFALSVSLAFYYENSYRVLVRYFFKFFQEDKIKFVGKDFHLLANPYSVVGFGLFCVFLTLLLQKQSRKIIITSLSLAIILFFATTITTSYFDSLAKVSECTACENGVRDLHYNNINYNFHFLTSLLVALSPLIWYRFKKIYSVGKTNIAA